MHERSSSVLVKLSKPMTGKAESGLQRCKKPLRIHQGIKIYFAEEKCFGLLNSYFKFEKANLRNKQERGTEGLLLRINYECFLFCNKDKMLILQLKTGAVILVL